MSEPNKDAAKRVERYNEYLRNKYGLLHERPRYRVIWSSNEFEHRRGQFKQDFTSAVEDEIVKYVQKYNYCLDRWILEKLITGANNIPKDLVSITDSSYEPLYVFWTGEEGDYEEPTQEQIDRRVHFDIYKTLYGHTITEAKIRELEYKKSEARRKDIRMQLDNALPAIPHALKKGSAVFHDARKVDAGSPTS